MEGHQTRRPGNQWKWDRGGNQSKTQLEEANTTKRPGEAERKGKERLLGEEEGRPATREDEIRIYGGGLSPTGL